MSTSQLTRRFAVLFLLAAACGRPAPPVPEAPPLDPELPFSCDDVKVAWTYTMPDEVSRLQFNAVADEAGNLYWLECPSTECSLVSMTPAGVERLRRRVPEAWPGQADMMVSHGRVYAYGRGSRPLVLSDSGEVLWSSGPGAEVVRAAVDPAGNLWTVERHIGGSSDFIVMYLGPTGTVLSTTPVNDRADGLVLDAQGTAHVTTKFRGRVSELYSIDSSGRVQRTDILGFGWVVAELDGRLLLADGSLVSTHDGIRLVAGPPPFGFPWQSPLLSTEARFRWALDLDGETAPKHLVLEGYAGLSEQPSFRSAMGPYTLSITVDPSSPILLSNGNALLATAGTLRSVAPDGRVVFSCPLGDVTMLTAASTLVGEKWVVLTQRPTASGQELKVWALTVPGLKVAAHGWTGRGGNPGHTGRARQ